MVAPETLQARLKELEQRINLNFFEVDKKLEDYERFESRSNVNFFEVEKRLVELEKRLEEHKPTSDARVKEMEDLLMMLELELVKLKEKSAMPAVAEETMMGVPSIVEDRLSVLEQNIKEIERTKIRPHGAKLDIEPKLKELETMIESLEEELKSTTKRLERELEGKALTERGAEHLLKDIEGEIEEVRQAINRAELVKRELLEKEKVLATKKEIELVEDRLSEQWKKILSEVDRSFATQKSLDTRIIDIEEKLEEREEALHAKLIKEANQLKKSITEEITTLQLDEENMKKIVQNELEKLQLDEENLRKAVDSRIKDYVDKINSQLTAFEQNIEGRVKSEIASHANSLIKLEEKFTKLVKDESRKDIDQELRTHREELKKLKEEFEKTFKEELGRIKPILTSEEVKTLMERVRNMEHEIETHTTRIITRELEAFADMIDKRFPSLATRDDFEKFAVRLSGKIAQIERPDMFPLARRVEDLEARFEELMVLLRAIGQRMPLVVE